MSDKDQQTAECDYFIESEDGSMTVRVSDDGGCEVYVTQVAYRARPGFSMSDIWNVASVRLEAGQVRELVSVLKKAR